MQGTISKANSTKMIICSQVNISAPLGDLLSSALHAAKRKLQEPGPPSAQGQGLIRLQWDCKFCNIARQQLLPDKPHRLQTHVKGPAGLPRLEEFQQDRHNLPGMQTDTSQVNPPFSPYSCRPDPTTQLRRTSGN